MSFITQVKQITTIVLKPSIITSKSKYLFILSHMRSRSSVLSHILGSNDDICGYSELHESYNRYNDIIKMKINLYNDLKCNFKDKYLLDKILNNDHNISKKILKKVKPKIIYLLREPESTIKSIINMGHITGIDWYKDSEKATKYYCSRLSYLSEYSKLLSGNYFFIESDSLINNTNNVLASLSAWLDLETPLVNSYIEFKNTGKPGFGDPSEKIHAGKLIKTTGYPDIEIPTNLLEDAISSYEECKISLTQYN